MIITINYYYNYVGKLEVCTAMPYKFPENSAAAAQPTSHGELSTLGTDNSDRSRLRDKRLYLPCLQQTIRENEQLLEACYKLV